MSNFDYDPGDTPTADPRTEQEPARVDRVGLPPGTGSLNPSALETHARAALQDRQRLLRDLGGTGSLRRSARLDEAPPALKQFLRGEVDLDSELARRFARSPLLTAIARSPQDTRHATQATAMLNSQDGSAMLSFDLYAEHEATEVTFTLSHMLALRFRLVGLSLYDKRRWLDLMRREAGAAFLWSNRRWEDDYAIFVLRPHYVRMYAFSPHRFEASVRITHQVMRQLINWLDMRWFQANR